MKDYKEYYNIVKSNDTATGSKPSVAGYLWIKVVDNGLLIALFILVITFFTSSIYASNEKISNFSMDAFKLTLGVFLGLFAGKRA
jgi:hypothetical protein